MLKLLDRQRLALVLLRTVIGWHFLYEGYYKLMLPGWSREGELLARWSASGYLKAAAGPFAGVFRALGASAASPWIDRVIPIALVAVGVSLILGLFTQLGCWGAVTLLTAFYLAQIPTAGMPQPGAEGTYLFVNKTLVEGAAVFVVLLFRTGTMAGLDLLRSSRAARTLPRQPAPAGEA